MKLSLQGKRGGKRQRQRTQTSETTPDARGNAFMCAFVGATLAVAL